jgi:geranylgeranyl transferase type-2 subunit beta
MIGRMSAEPYLVRLANRLSSHLLDLDDDRRLRHREFLLSHQCEDGGFRGREGDSDLYYTAFAVRGLGLLGGLKPAECERLAAYLRQHDWRSLGVIDLMNWLSIALAVQVYGGEDILQGESSKIAWADEMAAMLESVRTADGGYAKSTEGASGSTYHTFLVVLTCELLGRGLPRPREVVQFLYDRQRDDGGFVEIGPMKRSGTNPTAAASATLLLLDGMDEELKTDITEFLREVRSDEGGLQANTRIPFGDSLSTFTGLLTALDLGLDGVVDVDRAHAWLTGQLEFPTGGFRAATWDENADVEYTFYGLGLLALLREARSAFL